MSLCTVLQRAEEVDHLPTFLSQQGELFLAVEFALGSEQCWLGGWHDADKMKLLSFFFCVVFSVLFHCVAEIL